MYKLITIISLFLSVIPLIIAKKSYVYSSYCLSEYWYADMPICKLDLKIAVISTIIYFLISFSCIYIVSILIKKFYSH
jgi:hypothetical protein